MVKNCIAPCCFVFKDNKTLLIEHKALGGVWLMPGGHLEENEIPTDGAVRETKEETGLDVRLIGNTGTKSKSKKFTPLPIQITYTRVPYKDRPEHYHFNMLYLGEPINPKQKLKAEYGLGIGWFTEKEAVKLKMYVNVKSAIHTAFKAYGELKKSR